MGQELIIIFLLFFAVLAFGWFYWQRAKARTETTVTMTKPAEATEPPRPATPAARTDEPPTA